MTADEMMEIMGRALEHATADVGPRLIYVPQTLFRLMRRATRHRFSWRGTSMRQRRRAIVKRGAT